MALPVKKDEVMSMATLIGVYLRCGETSCAESDGHMCEKYRASYCEQFCTVICEKDGLPQRCPECLQHNLLSASFSVELDGQDPPVPNWKE